MEERISFVSSGIRDYYRRGFLSRGNSCKEALFGVILNSYALSYAARGLGRPEL